MKVGKLREGMDGGMRRRRRRERERERERERDATALGFSVCLADHLTVQRDARLDNHHNQSENSAGVTEVQYYFDACLELILLCPNFILEGENKQGGVQYSAKR